MSAEKNRMIDAWHRTRSSREAIDFSSNFWLIHRQDIDSGEFWADRIKQYRGEPAERLRIAINNLPLPGAFREAAIATRALINKKKKEKSSYQEELALLYWLAAVDSFSVPYSKVLNQPGYNVIESIPGAVVKNLPFNYQDLGYERLRLLNKTDVKWLRETWGDPKSHTTLHLLHNDVWKKYEAELKFKQEQQLRDALSKITDSEKRPELDTSKKKSNSIIVIIVVFLGLMAITIFGY